MEKLVFPPGLEKRSSSAETLTTYPTATLMGEYPISLHPRKSPKSPPWIFDERCVGWPITKRHLSPIPLTGQPWLSLSFGNQKQTFHGWKGPFKRIIDTTVMHVCKISCAPCWECIRIQNLKPHIYIFQGNDKVQPIFCASRLPVFVVSGLPRVSESTWSILISYSGT